LGYSTTGLNSEKSNHGQLEQEQTSVDMTEGTRVALSTWLNLSLVNIQELMQVDKVASEEEEKDEWENQWSDARVQQAYR
jgi:cytoplasmic iron level regulating protein YaaA (DUF328/UPF0246 family)